MAMHQKFDMDPNVWRVLIFRIWNIIAGIISVLAIPFYLPADVQGYYYTFLSIVALQALFDLGLSQTVLQVSSHEFAHTDFTKVENASLDRHIAKLAYLKGTITRWYRWVGSIFVAVVVLAGTTYFSLFGEKGAAHWFGPWVALVVATAANLTLSPRLAMVEGAGWTGSVASLRLVQSIIGHALLVASLAAGAGLWSVAAVPFTTSLFTFAWLRWRDNPYAAIPVYEAGGHDHKPWHVELVGLQWRVALAWLGGYFASQILVPVVFTLQGADEAGKLGLGLQIFGAVQVLGMAWISARAPLFGRLIARGESTELQARFARAALSSSLVSALISASVVMVLNFVGQTDLFLADRIPSMIVATSLAAVAVLGTVIHALAAYMRAHKEEPLVLSSLVIGGMTLCVAILGARISTDWAAIAYACVAAFVNLPWTIAIFRRYSHRNIMDIA